MPADFVLMTDDFSDLPAGFIAERKIVSVPTNFILDGVTIPCRDVAPKDFYKMLRDGKKPSTTAANTEEIKDVMEPHLKDGMDILYLAFSSGLSVTAHNGEIAAQELREQYPARKITVIDTLCASMGQGLFLYKASGLKREGKGLDEIADWAEKNRLRVAHLVMADDLMHLHRGGRVSRASAIAGSMFGIKPIIHLNDEGKLIAIDKARGKKQALTSLVDRLEKLAGDTPNDLFTISHADCEEDANFIAELMVKRFKIKNYMINYIGPIIGSHTGPGTVAVFLMVEHR